jgi:hypothetical protein
MKTARSIGFAILLTFGATSGSWAVDEGQTQPRLSSNEMYFANQTEDLIPLTSGSGNIKGVLCKSASSGILRNSRLIFYVDGIPAQTIFFDEYPFSFDNGSNYSTGTIPMNIRFESSIRVVMQRTSASSTYICMASWGLD